MAEPLRVCHVITDLLPHGAQIMLYRLLTQHDPQRLRPEVVSLLGEAAVGARIEALGVPVTYLNMRSGVPDPRALFRLARLLRQHRPDIVQTWLYHADLLGGLAARLAGRMPVVWGLHFTTLGEAAQRRTTSWTVGACARLSHSLPAGITSVANSAVKLHADLGYPVEKMCVIPPGIDIDVFRPDPEARVAFRAELGVAPDTPLVGLLARLHPMKNHAGLVAAAQLLRDRHPQAHFVLAGNGVTGDATDLVQNIRAAGLESKFHLLGIRDDTARVDAALDVFCLPSVSGEALPSVLLEAMSCGVPCVATDLGDSREVVAETGRIVPPGDTPALAAALDELLSLPATQSGELAQAARARVVEHYTLAGTAASYEALWRSILAARRSGQTA